MTAPGPTPPPTAPEIFRGGTPVYVVSGVRSWTMEDWVRGIARMLGLRMDWRIIGGRCVVLVLGDRAACELAQNTCAAQMEALRDQYMACRFNWSPTPERSDVDGYPTDLSEA